MKKKINTRDGFGYILFMTLANLAGAAAMLVFMYFVSKSNDTDLVNQYFVPFSLLVASIAVATSALITGIYFHRKLPDIIPTEGNTGSKNILTSYLRLVLPGEILRFILCSIPTKPGMMFGYRFFDGFLALAPNYLWDMFYVIPKGRMEHIRKIGYSGTDNLVFLAFYLAYLVVILAVYFFLFKRAWQAEETTRKNEVKLRMDPDQMK